MKLSWQIKNVNGQKVLYPFCNDAETALAKYHQNQVVTSNKISGTLKERSLKENNLYFKACQVFYDLISPDKRFQNKEQVDVFFRHYCKHYDYEKTIVLPDNSVHFILLPLNFKGCDQAIANKYYQRAFDGMSEFLMVDTDTFIKEVKARMGV